MGDKLEVSYKEVVDSLAQDIAQLTVERNMYMIQCAKLEEELARRMEVEADVQ